MEDVIHSNENALILLVEDNPDDALLIQRAFKKAKITNPLAVVNDGEKAITWLKGAPPFTDRKAHPIPIIILLDLSLPKKSGFEVLSWLKGQQVLKRIPVVVLTSSQETPDINRAFDLGANSYLVKPVSFDTLTQMVQTLNLYWLILNEKPEARHGT